MVEEFAIRYGSGGAGKNRGGDGVIRKLRFREAMQAAILSGRRTVSPFGLNGGGPGLPGRNYILRSDGSIISLGGCDEARSYLKNCCACVIRGRAVLGILMYHNVHCGSCAPASPG